MTCGYIPLNVAYTKRNLHYYAAASDRFEINTWYIYRLLYDEQYRLYNKCTVCNAYTI